MKGKFKGDTLKNLRLWYGHTQLGLSAIIGVKERDIWNWENGYDTPSFNDINKLKGYFKVKSGYFFNDDILKGTGDRIEGQYISLRY